jgi:hypothetical protein
VQQQVKSGDRERPLIKAYEGQSGVGKTRGARHAHPDALDYCPEYDTNKPWWGSDAPPARGSTCFIDEPVDNSDPGNLKARFKFAVMRQLTGGGPCQLETKNVGVYINFMCTTIVTACTVRIEEWYLLPNGDVHPEWLRRLIDFCVVYEVQPGDLLPSGELTTAGVPFRDLWAARKAERDAQRAAAAAAEDDSGEDDSGSAS